jgi:norsolorinic acid ketoreductase
MSKGGKFIFMSSGASPIDRIPDKEDAGYGITKVSISRHMASSLLAPDDL